MLEEAYRLRSTQSQVSRGAMELGLLPRSIVRDFLKQSKEGKRLSHERNELGKTCFEGHHFENTRIRTLRGKNISRASDLLGQYQSSDNLHRGNTDKAVDLMDLLEVQVEESEQLPVKSKR